MLADESHHRDVNHALAPLSADTLGLGFVGSTTSSRKHQHQHLPLAAPQASVAALPAPSALFDIPRGGQYIPRGEHHAEPATRAISADVRSFHPRPRCPPISSSAPTTPSCKSTRFGRGSSGSSAGARAGSSSGSSSGSLARTHHARSHVLFCLNNSPGRLRTILYFTLTLLHLTLLHPNQADYEAGVRRHTERLLRRALADNFAQNKTRSDEPLAP